MLEGDLEKFCRNSGFRYKTAMIYAFDDFELDTARMELRRAGGVVAVEPQVFALILLLLENRDRLVPKDEVIEKIWDGRIISDAALSSRVKSARQALGDDGKSQKFIRTLHGQGFRFVAQAQLRNERIVIHEPEKPPVASAEAGRPSIAVLPFRLIGAAGPHAIVADALPIDLITALSRLRWLFVIARASSFRFRGNDVDLDNVRKSLGVRYCLSGSVEVVGDRITVAAELADTASGAALWGERFPARVDDVHEIRDRIISSIIGALELHIPAHEAMAARLKPLDQLDAWSAYHLGLQHFNRFNQRDNAAAAGMFELAIERAPDFARAHAALSSAHFQNAFLKYSNAPTDAPRAARAAAERSVELDPLDPFANFALGRVHWVEDNVVGGHAWLDRSVSLCPNYAQGIYARGWTESIAGLEGDGLDGMDHALALSPLDPFRYAMLGVKSFIYIQNDDFASGASFADEAARSPGAHVLIAAIAAAAQKLNGDEDKALRWAQLIRERRPDLSRADFFRAFPFSDPIARDRLDTALSSLGF